ncbi:hypothetical protein BRARA_C03850 [Brassica rapa]|uniref:Uncharacterized protein n=1 Tax=Brassica campestris TaxID=3711 RepID=A0A398A293_BRACM|nr:hypothetical protein BRARA_C03850 [Brassica rapa]
MRYRLSHQISIGRISCLDAFGRISIISFIMPVLFVVILVMFSGNKSAQCTSYQCMLSVIFICSCCQITCYFLYFLVHYVLSRLMLL